ncbi:hypothetical protein BDZ94DRAFT_1301940 [Collybia nuda]|uniref:Uncharacterized protein n=1 Tax=Collybia nuda TaxID=64659 RepID=A0A9P5XUS4_9AGAR|nr:hypothetical protein BDZ94DRAFT_1301940 [Collybia nuda]
MMAAVRAQFNNACTPECNHMTSSQGRLSVQGVPPRSAPPNVPSTSRAPVQPSPAPATQPQPQPHSHSQVTINIPTITFLDAAFRTYADRCATELSNLRTVCTRAILKERQDREKWRSHCVTFKQERDIARDRVRALIGEREAHLVRPVISEDQTKDTCPAEGESKAISESFRSVPSRESTPSSTAVASDPEDDVSFYLLPYPSPTRLVNAPVASPVTSHKRSRSADAVLPSSSSSKRDLTAFDITVTENPHGDRLIPTERAMKRRRSEDPPASARFTSVEGGGLGECDMELESEVDGAELQPKLEVQETPRRNLRSPSGSPSLHASPIGQPSPAIELSHVDLMYLPTNGKLVCRVCMLASSKVSISPHTPAPLVTSFPTDSAWDTLRDHCAKEHASECADIARLHPAEVYELRRRLSMR